jgi:ribonuclease PH
MAKSPDQLRPLTIEPQVSRYAEGSALITCGHTRVLCTASVAEDVPIWMRGRGRGWVTAEYGMLPRATHTRKPRDITRGRPDARGLEIQRLIGRSLRAAVLMERIGERTITVDCDVLEADGGTRTASITGGMVALSFALGWLQGRGLLGEPPLNGLVAATSVGIIDGVPTLDLAYEEDARAETDMNVVMDATGRLIEIQGTAERAAFSREELGRMLDLADQGISELMARQRDVIGEGILDRLTSKP